MRPSLPLAALAATILFNVGAALAQGPGTGPGPGGGPGYGRGGMGPRVGGDYTPGWSMMTPGERDEHRQRMHSAKTPEECRQIVDEHRKLMEQRAKERGVTPGPGPRQNACPNVGG